MNLNTKQMISLVRGYTNQRGQDSDTFFFTDAEIMAFLTKNWNDLYYMMTNARENYFLKKISRKVDANDEIVISDLYRILKIDYVYSNSYKTTVQEVDLRDENRLNNDGYYYNNTPFVGGYRGDDSYRSFIVQNNNTIKIIPANHNSGDYEISYIPEPPELQVQHGADSPAGLGLGITIDNPAINIPKGFDMWIILSTSIDIGIPEEGDLKNLMAKQKYWLNRINDYMTSKTNLQPKKIHKAIDYSGASRESIEGLWGYDL